jgi:ribosomal protein L33
VRPNRTSVNAVAVKKSTPVPGDAISVAPYANENGTTVGVSDAGRLLHFAPDAHGVSMAHYHSLSANKTASTPQSAIARLEEGADANEGRDPSLKIVPLKIGDTKHAGRSVIFHNGVAQGTVDPGKVGGQKIVTVSSAAMGPDRHFLDRDKAIDAIHDHFVPQEIEKALTVADLLKSSEDTPIHGVIPKSKKEKLMSIADIRKAGTAHDPATGQFTSGSGEKYSVKSSSKKVPDQFSPKRYQTHEQHSLTHEDGRHVGDVKSRGKKFVSQPKSDHGAKVHDTKREAMQRLASIHESGHWDKSLTIADIRKAGTAHDPATGQFTSGSGEKYSVKSSSKKVPDQFSSKRYQTHEQHSLTHEDGRHVGDVKSRGKKFVSQPKSDHGAKVHDTKREAMQRLASIHESGHWDKSLTIGDLMKSETCMTIGDLFKRKGHARTIGDLLKAEGVVSPGAAGASYTGSFEDTLKRIKGPVCMASGCENPPKYDDNGIRVYEPSEPSGNYAHYLDVIATFPEYAIVRCSDEDKAWKVPYEFDGDTVSAGQPEEVVAQFVPADEAEGDASDDAEGDDEDEDDDE